MDSRGYDRLSEVLEAAANDNIVDAHMISPRPAENEDNSNVVIDVGFRTDFTQYDKLLGVLAAAGHLMFDGNQDFSFRQIKPPSSN